MLQPKIHASKFRKMARSLSAACPLRKWPSIYMHTKCPATINIAGGVLCMSQYGQLPFTGNTNKEANRRVPTFLPWACSFFGYSLLVILSFRRAAAERLVTWGEFCKCSPTINYLKWPLAGHSSPTIYLLWAGGGWRAGRNSSHYRVAVIFHLRLIKCRPNQLEVKRVNTQPI